MSNSVIENVEWLGLITGPDSLSADVCARAQVGGTDLGFPVFVESNRKMFLFFGDTFQVKMQGLWRSNVCAYTSQTDKLTDGLRLEGFLMQEDGKMAKGIVNSSHVVCDERTKIPTGSIYVDGTIYLFFFSKYAWVANGVPRDRSMNFGGAVKSVDEGKTWQRLPELTWFDHNKTPEDYLCGNNTERLRFLALEDVDLTALNAETDICSHTGYYFTQMFPVDGKDGYIYFLGEGGYRSSGMKLARVKKEIASIENFEEYFYFNGIDDEGNPVWLKGSSGLKTVCENEKAFIIDDVCGEQSCIYNEYLKKWIVAYTTVPDRISYVFSEQIWGPYSEPRTLIDTSYPFPNKDTSIYGGFMHEKWTEEKGKVFYFIMSQYDLAYNSSIVKVTLK